MAEKHLFTSESVAEGHPDKIADQISDSVVDSILSKDPNGRVACECLVTTGLVLIAGEIHTDTYVDIPSTARGVIRDIGYTDPHLGFDFETAAVLSSIDEQSGDIAMGVDKGGAGDQGMMFGFACTQTDVLMPMPIIIAHRLVKRLADVRRAGILDFLRPDGKSQVTIEYEDHKPKRLHAVVVSAQHRDDVSIEHVREGIAKEVIRPVVSEMKVDASRYDIHVNPTGRFVKGGPAADTGLTGRKIIVDTYGGFASHGGGAFSGKDPTKVDRSAAYAARHLAKNIVAAGLATECLIQVAYAIGVVEPVSIFAQTYGTGVVPDHQLDQILQKYSVAGGPFDLTPRGIIERLNLRRPIYRKTAAYGHFGRTEKEFSWEHLDLVKPLKKLVK